MNNHSYLFDEDLEFKDAGLVAASAAAQVDAAAKIVDLGAGYVCGDLVIDVSVIEIASNDELYEIGFQVSSSSTFASTIEEVCALKLGALEVTNGDVDSTATRYILRVSNEMQGVIYRYARVYTTVSGTIAGGGGINYTAFLTRCC